MATAYEQLNFINQQMQQSLAPINNFLAQRNALAMQQMEAARQRAQMIEMENLRQQHALEAQKANFEAQQVAADKHDERQRANANRERLVNAGWQLSPDLTPREINNMADNYFGDPYQAEESSVEQATAIGGRVKTVLADMTKEMSTDTPEAQKKALMAFAADPTNNNLLTVEGKIPQQMLMEVVNKGDVNGLVGLINQAARNAGWFSSDKQVAAQLMAGLYNSRLAANESLKASPTFQAKTVQLQTLMSELGKATQGIRTEKGWTTFGNAMSPPKPSDAEVAAKMKEALARQQAINAESARKQQAVQNLLSPVAAAPAPGITQQGVFPWAANQLSGAGGSAKQVLQDAAKNMAVQFAAPAAAPALPLSQLAQFGDYLSQNPVAQDISHGLYQGWYGNGDIVKTTSPHEQLARELYARGIYDPRLGVPEQALRGF